MAVLGAAQPGDFFLCNITAEARFTVPKLAPGKLFEATVEVESAKAGTNFSYVFAWADPEVRGRGRAGRRRRFGGGRFGGGCGKPRAPCAAPLRPAGPGWRAGFAGPWQTRHRAAGGARDGQGRFCLTKSGQNPGKPPPVPLPLAPNDGADGIRAVTGG